MAVLVKVETEVTVVVEETVSTKVVGVVIVVVCVVTWIGTKRVDWVIEVKVVASETVVKSVTTVGTTRVGIAPFMTIKELKVMALLLLEPVEDAELLLLVGADTPMTL